MTVRTHRWADTNEDDVTADARAINEPRGGTGVSSVEETYGVDDGRDMDPATQTGDRRAELRRLVLLQKLRVQVQLPTPGPFDKEDIMWVKKTNWSGRGKKEVLHASFRGTSWKTSWKGNQPVAISPVRFSGRRGGLSRPTL
jgi:hypothetical protein